MMNRSSAPRRRIAEQQQVTRMIEEVGARVSPVYRDDDVESDISASEALYSTRDGNDDSTKQEAMSIARTETKVVRSLKLFMLGILLISSIGVATAVYFYTNDSEQQQFQIAFNENSRKVLEVRRIHSLLYNIATTRLKNDSSPHLAHRPWDAPWIVHWEPLTPIQLHLFPAQRARTKSSPSSRLTTSHFEPKRRGRSPTRSRYRSSLLFSLNSAERGRYTQRPTTLG
jgi:hypothetical protein